MTATVCNRIKKAGTLPYIHTVDPLLPTDLWEDVRSRCPYLRTIVHLGIGDHEDDPWLQESGIYELEGMKVCTHLTSLKQRDTDNTHISVLPLVMDRRYGQIVEKY